MMNSVKPKTATPRPFVAAKPAVRAAKPIVKTAPAPLRDQDIEDIDEVLDEDLPHSESRFPKWLLAIVAVAIVGIAALTLYGAKGKSHVEQETHAPAVASRAAVPFTRCVAAPGLVESASGLRNLSFELPGKLKAVLVDEGETVKAGQLLAELENTDLTAQLESARAELAIAESQQKILDHTLVAEVARATQDVQRLKAECAMLDRGPRAEEIAQAEGEVRMAEADSVRTANEAKRFSDEHGLKSGAWTEADRDTRKHQSDAALGKLDTAKARLLQLKNGYRQEERTKAQALLASAAAELARLESTRDLRLAAARSQVAQARARANIAEAELNKTRLLAPIVGRVIWKFMHTGESVDALRHQPIVAVADCSRLRVRAYIDETDFPKIASGQSVKIRADAYEAKYFNGKVERVNASAGEKPFSTGEARERSDVKVVEAIVQLAPDCPLKLGLRVTAFFEHN